LTEKMVEAGDKLARFVGLDAYAAAGGATRADLFGKEIYLENPGLLHRLAQDKLEAIRKELQAEGWGWLEIDPERDYDAINRCGRLQPRLIGAPSELIELKSQLDGKLDDIHQALRHTESDALLDQEEAIRTRLDEAEETLAAYVGFDATQKALAGCYVSVGHDGSLCLDKGLVKPEHRKLLNKLLKGEEAPAKAEGAKRKDTLPESLRRDLAAYRLQVAQVEIARQPQIAFDLLAFHAACQLLDNRPIADGLGVQFHRPRGVIGTQHEATPAAQALAAIFKALPAGWRNQRSEADRFQAFRALPERVRQRWLGYCVALTLQPKLGPATADPMTAYDVALALTGANVADYWRPTKANFFSRRSREQLLGIAREVLGDAWGRASSKEKKSVLVEQLDRAFADSANPGRPREQAERLKSWLPTGMAFGAVATPKPAKAIKAKKAA
ncbi:MAG TPA: hypothetical protein VFA18_02490, partial [Gemmataceae bacterium]|nr:hypothetical protein [Gemmataceae bacterium]